MKRSNKLYILLGLLAVLCAAVFGVSRYEEKKEQIKNSGEIILQIAAEDVTGLSWEYEEQSLAFHKEEGWLYDEDAAFPADEEKINDLLEVFSEFAAAFVIEEVEDFGQYGLDDPLCTIRLQTKEKEYEISLGDFSTMDSQRYVSIGDGNVYLVKEDPMESYQVVLSDMILQDEIPVFEQADKISFSGVQDYEIAYQAENTYTYCEEDRYFTEKDGRQLPLDTYLVDSYLQTVSGLGLTDYVTYNATEEELQTYGLAEPELTVSVEHSWEDAESKETKSGSFVLHVSRDPKELKEAEEAKAKEEAAAAKKAAKDAQEEAAASEAEGTAAQEEATAMQEDSSQQEEITAYARVGESRIIYRLTGQQYENLMAASYNDLRHQQVFSGEFDQVTQIDINLEGNAYSITAAKEDEEIIYSYGEEQIDVSDLRTALAGLEAAEFTQEAPKQQEEISLTLSLDNENDPEVSFAFYRYDGANCLATVDGEPLCLVSRSGVVDLIEAVHAIVLDGE